MIAGIVSGFSTSIITVFIVRILILETCEILVPSSLLFKSQLSKVNVLVQVKRACLVVVYFSILGWMATQYLIFQRLRENRNTFLERERVVEYVMIRRQCCDVILIHL